MRDDNIIDTPQIIASFETHHKNLEFSRLKSFKEILKKDSKKNFKEFYIISSYNINISSIILNLDI